MPDAAESVGVYCLDVGQGDCTFILGPPDVAIMCDCADAGVARKFVSDHDIRRLDAVVVTHLDRDHIQGVLPFLRSFIDAGGSVGTVYVDRDRRLSDLRSQKIASLLLDSLLKWEDAKTVALGAPDRDASAKRIAGGADWDVEIALPTHADRMRLEIVDSPDPNARSAVVRVKRGNAVVLVGGDATLPSWQRMDGPTIRASAIRVSHHGGDLGATSGGWTTRELYDAVGADHAVISVGTKNRHGHPLPLHVADVRACGAVIRCTQLTPRCDPGPASFRASALRSGAAVAYPYRHYRNSGALVSREEVPCASSVVVMLDAQANVAVEPAATGWHRAFVDGLAHPLCRPPTT